MKLPIIIAVDDDPQVLRSINRDLRKEYRKNYRVISSESAKEALELIKELRAKGEMVSLLLSDQRMPEMSGVEYLEQARTFYPDAKKVLLTAYSDKDAAIKAINDVQLDYYLMKPWDPPEEKLYPTLSDLLVEWEGNYVPEFSGMKIVGYQFSPKSHEIKEFLAGNLVPYQWMDIETDAKAKELVAFHQLDLKDLPVVFYEDGSYHAKPELKAIAEKTGFKAQASETLYDVVIIGAGPAGLAASVYGASEGLKTLLIEKKAPGGQAGTSSRIENYLGFPSGVSGGDLTRRAITQSQRLGAEFLSPQEVTGIKTKDSYKIIQLADGTEVHARAIIITTGVDYRKLESKGINDFTGAGIYYGAAMTEAPAQRDREVYVVGGGNSAGQAAMYLSKFAKRVSIVIRREDLSATMSQYLIDQINETSNIRLVPRTVVSEAKGTDKLEQLVIENIDTANKETVEAHCLFIFIGARPYTDWIENNIIKNDRGFIETGHGLYKYGNFKQVWKQGREPYLLETCNPGIFAAGDVRAGAMNRVASAVGEGSMAIKFVHEYLAAN